MATLGLQILFESAKELINQVCQLLRMNFAQQYDDRVLNFEFVLLEVNRLNLSLVFEILQFIGNGREKQ